MTGRPAAVIGGVVAALAVSGCAIRPEPITEAENAARIAEIRTVLAEQPAPKGPIGLHEAVARALRYNLSTRVKEVERQIAENRADASIWTLMPKIIGTGTKTGRSNTQASSSKSVTTNQQSLETSTSQDSNYDTADLKATWNVLDFGVSYFTGRQLANQSMVAEERRRKVLQQLVADVRDAYWKAVSAERLLDRIDDALAKVKLAIEKAEGIEESRAQKPAEILGYQRELYSKLLQLQGLRRTLLASKFELAKMMNLPPGVPFRVQVPAELPQLPALAAPIENLEESALVRRPELVEETLQERVAADEVRKAIARMFPGIEFGTSRNYNSNSYLLHNHWTEASLKVTWNLMNLLSGWDDIDQAEKQKQLAVVRRQTLGMAVLTQVNVAYLDYREAEEAFVTASKIQKVNERIEVHKQQEAQSQNLGDLELIQTQLNSLLSQMKKDEQYAQVQSSLGRLVVSVGEDPFAGLDEGLEVDTLAKAVEEREKAWFAGPWFVRVQPRPTS